MEQMGVDGGLRVNHGALEAAAADMRATVQGIDSRLDRLESELAPLRSDWVGDAQRAYTVAQARWNGAIREMKELLDQSQRAVLASNDDYRAADQRGAAAFEF